MPTPLISATSTWQSNYDHDRDALSTNNQTAANTTSNNAFQAANAANTPQQRDAALSNAQSALTTLRDSVGGDNAAVKDLQGLVDVATFQHDALANKSADTLVDDANRAVDSLKAVDPQAARTFVEASYLRIEGAQGPSSLGKGFAFHDSAVSRLPDTTPISSK